MVNPSDQTDTRPGPARPAAAAEPSRDRGGNGSAADFRPEPGSPPVEWVVADGLTDYEAAIAEMEARVALIAAGQAPERIWLVEHPPLYTAGTSARPHDLLDPARLPVYATGRGGEYTYHGPGQRVVYVMLDLKRRRQDVRRFVAALEDWVIAVLWHFALRGLRRDDRIGVWIERPDRPELSPGVVAEDKIAAIGIRLRKWVSFHGLSLNVEPDLAAFDGIVPCGIRGYGVTSLVDLGRPVTLPDVDVILRQAFEPIFGPTVDA